MLSRLKRVINKFKVDKLKRAIKQCGQNVIIEIDGGEFSILKNISIGNNVYIGPNAYINAVGGVEIQSGSIIGPFVKIQTVNHRYNDINLEAIPYDGVNLLKSVIIEENVWIGMDVKICPGVIIGEGAVVAMGSVVTKNVPSMAVVGGNPAKIIKYRDIDLYNELKNSDKIYLKLKNEKQIHMKYL